MIWWNNVFVNVGMRIWIWFLLLIVVINIFKFINENGIFREKKKLENYYFVIYWIVFFVNVGMKC